MSLLLLNSFVLCGQSSQRLFNQIWPSQIISPTRRYSGLAPIGTCELPAHGTGGVGVIAEVNSPKDGLAEIVRIPKGPQGRFEASYHIARALNFRRLPGAESPAGNVLNARMQSEVASKPLQWCPIGREYLVSWLVMD